MPLFSDPDKELPFVTRSKLALGATGSFFVDRPDLQQIVSDLIADVPVALVLGGILRHHHISAVQNKRQVNVYSSHHLIVRTPAGKKELKSATILFFNFVGFCLRLNRASSCK